MAREKEIAKVTQGFGLSKQADGETFTETGKIRGMGEGAQDNKACLGLTRCENNQEEGLAGRWSHRPGVWCDGIV